MLDLKRENDDWSFESASRRQTNYVSHGYHHYPAKFIPQLVQKLIGEYSSEGDLIVDPFGGCGTTLVESKLSNRQSICGDINDVAVMISRAKKSPIVPKTLERKNTLLLNRITKRYPSSKNFYNKANPRLQYWFHENEYNRLMEIFLEIQRERNSIIKNFYNCCFSNILKKCSIWYSKSIKPMKDLHKNIPDPLVAFQLHLKFMTERNSEFYALSSSKDKFVCKMIKSDARQLPINKNEADLIITSPPYVTSYEYAELHQLSTLWFGYASEMKDIKKNFIGTSSRAEASGEFNSKIATKIISSLGKKSKRLSRHASNYYSDLYKSFMEMHRILKKNKFACIIMGNTEFKSIKILNTEASIEMLKNIGFDVKKVIKRKLSSKIFTPYRDSKGKFTNKKMGKNKKIYQYEYIIIAQKK